MSEASQANSSGVEADLRFHRGILAASRNPLLLQMGHLIGAGLLISHRFSRESFDIFLPKHRQVMRAIEAQDPARARKTMEQLLTETRTYLKDHIRND
jgi:DNA-binding FadR family transcriptional regulator